MRSGYFFDEIKDTIKHFDAFDKELYRIAYGTRSKRFHLILPDDRDYGFGDCSIEQFLEFTSEKCAKLFLCRPLLV